MNEKGLHTRPSTHLVKTLMAHSSDVEVSLNGVTADGKSVMGLLALAAKKGSDLAICVSGEDEEIVSEVIRKLISGGIPEEGPCEPH